MSSEPHEPQFLSQCDASFFSTPFFFISVVYEPHDPQDLSHVAAVVLSLLALLALLVQNFTFFLNLRDWYKSTHADTVRAGGWGGHVALSGAGYSDYRYWAR